MIFSFALLSACSMNQKTNKNNESLMLTTSLGGNDFFKKVGSEIEEVQKNDNVLFDNQEEIKNMKINIQSDGHSMIFELNDSIAAKELYEQLPLTMDVENYGDNEKIFYPPQKLSTNDTPLADARLGTLAYYAPWGDVVIFYGDFGGASGLYELGKILSGEEHIKNIVGSIEIQKIK